MRIRYKTFESQYPYFLTCTIVGWLPVFTRASFFKIILEALAYCRSNKKLKIFAYVLMDNHLHLIAQAMNLSAIMRDFKSFTAREIIRMAQREKKAWLLDLLNSYKKDYKDGSTFQVWQEGFHPQMLTDVEMIRQKIEYIHYNPVRAGLVAEPDNWQYSSAKDYHGGQGLLAIDQLEI